MSCMFYGATFEVVVEDRKTPVWKPVLETTDRKLLGTHYMERNWRHTVWVFDAPIWIPPSDQAEQFYLALLWAYRHVLPDLWVFGSEQYTAILVGFVVDALTGGYDGYEGQATFIRPGG